MGLDHFYRGARAASQRWRRRDLPGSWTTLAYMPRSSPRRTADYYRCGRRRNNRSNTDSHSGGKVIRGKVILLLTFRSAPERCTGSERRGTTGRRGRFSEGLNPARYERFRLARATRSRWGSTSAAPRCRVMSWPLPEPLDDPALEIAGVEPRELRQKPLALLWQKQPLRPRRTADPRPLQGRRCGLPPS